MCPCRWAGCLWGCIVGSTRLLLFFATILLIPLSILNMVALYQLFNMYYEESPLGYMQIRIHLFTVISIFVAFVGAFGAFCEHRPSLKMFSTLTGLKGLVIVGLLFWANSSNFFQRSNNEFLVQMSQEQEKYDWLAFPPFGPERAATFAWDKMQYGTCCGLLGPKDWDKFRPAGLDKDVYPGSCCQNFEFYRKLDIAKKQLCRAKDMLVETGCREKLDNNIRGITLYFMMYAMIQIVLAGVACCIRSHVEARLAEEREFMAHVTIVATPQVEKSPSALYPNLGYGSLA